MSIEFSDLVLFLGGAFMAVTLLVRLMNNYHRQQVAEIRQQIRREKRKRERIRKRAEARAEEEEMRAAAIEASVRREAEAREAEAREAELRAAEQQKALNASSESSPS